MARDKEKCGPGWVAVESDSAAGRTAGRIGFETSEDDDSRREEVEDAGLVKTFTMDGTSETSNFENKYRVFSAT